MRRVQAGAPLLYLSGRRVGALGALLISANNISQWTLKQWAKLGVRPTNGKTATSYWLAIPELLEVVDRWNSVIRTRLPPTGAGYP